MTEHTLEHVANDMSAMGKVMSISKTSAWAQRWLHQTQTGHSTLGPDVSRVQRIADMA